jgi:hypothetical protein
MSKPIALLAALAAAALVPVAFAGPPLICHMFSIGNAKSLPWSAGNSGARDWNSPRADYDTSHLADDTVALLTDSTPAIVRMETIRRAVLYSASDASLGKVLLDRFRTRASGRNGDARNALQLFDYGYLIETMKQGSSVREMTKLSGAVAGLNGYSYIQEALRLRGSDPEMEFAAAVVTLWPKNEHHQEHFRKAVDGSGADAMLATNLLEQFSDRGRTLAELRAR